MKIFNIRNPSGTPAVPKCYNVGKGTEYVRTAMIHYGQLLGRAAMSYVSATATPLHIACMADDIDTLARGVVEGTQYGNFAFSVYYPANPYSAAKPIHSSRHQKKGASETCLIVLPILNQPNFPIAVIEDIAERSEKESIILLTPAVVPPADKIINSYLWRKRRKVSNRFDIITLFLDEKRQFAWTAGWYPAVPDNNEYDCHFLLNVLRNTYKDDLHPYRP